jgi:hypothetical protein
MQLFYNSLNYNDYFVSGQVCGFFIGGSDRTRLLWKTATGKDTNSVSGDPKYVAPRTCTLTLQ